MLKIKYLHKSYSCIPLYHYSGRCRHRRKRYHRCLCVLFLWFFLYCIGTLARANNFRASFRPNVGGGLTSRPCSGNGNPDGSGQSTTDGNIANDGDGDSYEKDIKTKILQSSLQHVPRHGWSRDTVAAGIQIFSIIIVFFYYALIYM